MRLFIRLSMARLLICCLLLGLWGCASWPGGEPLQVNLAGIEALPSEGMEVRMAVKLRMRNPNDTPVDFDGVSLNLEVRGQDFASGVSDARGSVPRFGETVLTVPVTVSAMAIVRQAFSFAAGERSKLDFVARGKLAGGAFGGVRFESKGEFDLPAAALGRTTPGGN